MRNIPLRAMMATACLAAATFLGWFWIQPDGMEPGALVGTYDIPRQVRFNYAIRNTGNKVVRDAKFYVYAPILQTGTQLVEKIESVIPHSVERDPLGQQLLVFDLPDLPPYGRLDLAYASRLSLANVPNASEEKLPRSYLEAQPLIESDHPDIQSLAQVLKGEDPLTSARNIYQWVADNLVYTGPRGKDRGARHTFESRRGDCTDAAFLVVALCRAAGIPARCVGGYVCTQDKNLAARQYHNWAEFRVDGHWQVADPVNRCFVARPETYIATRIWGAEEDGDPVTFWRHWVEGELLKVRMVG